MFLKIMLDQNHIKMKKFVNFIKFVQIQPLKYELSRILEQVTPARWKEITTNMIDLIYVKLTRIYMVK